MKERKVYTLEILYQLRSAPDSNIRPLSFMIGDCFSGGLWNPCKYFGCTSISKQRPSTRNSTGSNFQNTVNNLTHTLNKDIHDLNATNFTNGGFNKGRSSNALITTDDDFNQPHTFQHLVSPLSVGPNSSPGEFSGFFSDNCLIMDNRLGVVSLNNNSNLSGPGLFNSHQVHYLPSKLGGTYATSSQVTPLFELDQHPASTFGENLLASRSFTDIGSNYSHGSKIRTVTTNLISQDSNVPLPSVQRRHKPSFNHNNGNYAINKNACISPTSSNMHSPSSHQESAVTNKHRSCFFTPGSQFLPEWMEGGTNGAATRQTMELNGIRDDDQNMLPFKQHRLKGSLTMVKNSSTKFSPASKENIFTGSIASTTGGLSRSSTLNSAVNSDKQQVHKPVDVEWPAFLQDKVRIVRHASSVTQRTPYLLSVPSDASNGGDYHHDEMMNDVTSRQQADHVESAKHQQRRAFRRENHASMRKSENLPKSLSKLANENSSEVAVAPLTGAYILSLIGCNGVNEAPQSNNIVPKMEKQATSQNKNGPFDLTNLELMLKADLRSMETLEQSDNNLFVSPKRLASIISDFPCSNVLTVEEIENSYLS